MIGLCASQLCALLAARSLLEQLVKVNDVLLELGVLHAGWATQIRVHGSVRRRSKKCLKKGLADCARCA